MPLPLADVRLTTRRARGAAADDLPVVYPRLLRDATILPKIAIAIGYFESMVGKERRELEPDLLVQFFGDHKLARCLVACLARTYRYHSPRLAACITPTAWRRCQSKGITSPVGLRLALYDRVNAEGEGFLGRPQRDPAFRRLERHLALRGGELDRLLTLDAPEHAILVRDGPSPRPEDVAAQYNLAALDTLLRQAEQVDLAIAGLTPEDRVAVARLCAGRGVMAELKAGSRATLLRLRGQQDAMGLWSRHGRRLAHVVLDVLERSATNVLEVGACLSLRGKRALLRLTPETLSCLGASLPPAGWDDLHVDAVAGAAASPAVLLPDVLATVRLLGWDGWRVRRIADAQGWKGGVLLPDVLLDSPRRRVQVCWVRSAAHAARLALLWRHIQPPVTAPGGVLFVGLPVHIAPLAALDANTLAVQSEADSLTPERLSDLLLSKEVTKLRSGGAARPVLSHA